LFAILTFREAPPRSKADRLLYEWLDEIEQEDGDADFRWCRVVDRSTDEDWLCFYILVGGLRSGSRHYWAYRWEELAGDASISYPFTGGGAKKLLAEAVSPRGDFAVQYKLGLAAPAWVA